MQLIDADKAQPGTTVLTKSQSAGKGQRGKTWTDKPGESILMSLITAPPFTLDRQFIFSALVANTIVETLKTLELTFTPFVKWPNDIILNDKKAGGILIENVLRGNNWSFAVIGLGLNVLQDNFPEILKTATSLKIVSGQTFDLNQLMHIIRQNLLTQMAEPPSDAAIMRKYNDHLYQRQEWQGFLQDGEEVLYLINEVLPNGQLQVVDNNGETRNFHHGDVQWIW